MAAGDFLCYVKGGSALAYSKIASNNGALIYKSSNSIYIILTPRPQSLDYIYVYYSDDTTKYVATSGYTQKVTKLNNQHVILTKTQDSPYTLRLDGLTTNDSVDISYTVSFSMNSDHDAGTIHSGYMFGEAVAPTRNKFAFTDSHSIDVSSSQSYVTYTLTYRLIINTSLEDWFTIEDL